MKIRPSAIKWNSKNKKNQKLRHPLLLNTIQRIPKLQILPFSLRLTYVHIKQLSKEEYLIKYLCSWEVCEQEAL